MTFDWPRAPARGQRGPVVVAKFQMRGLRFLAGEVGGFRRSGVKVFRAFGHRLGIEGLAVRSSNFQTYAESCAVRELRVVAVLAPRGPVAVSAVLSVLFCYSATLPSAWCW